MTDPRPPLRGGLPPEGGLIQLINVDMVTGLGPLQGAGHQPVG
jgi:hypothetical protein